MDVLYEPCARSQTCGLGQSYRYVATCLRSCKLTASIDVVGFYFLDLATSYTPPQDLAHFLASGPPPVYIGYFLPALSYGRSLPKTYFSFGSVVVDDPAEMTRVIFEATHAVGVRALVSSGWVCAFRCLVSV